MRHDQETQTSFWVFQFNVSYTSRAPDFGEMMSKGNHKLDFSVPEKTKNIFGWLDLVIMESFPFSIVEDPFMRQYSRLSPIARKYVY